MDEGGLLSACRWQYFVEKDSSDAEPFHRTMCRTREKGETLRLEEEGWKFLGPRLTYTEAPNQVRGVSKIFGRVRWCLTSTQRRVAPKKLTEMTSFGAPSTI